MFNIPVITNLSQRKKLYVFLTLLLSVIVIVSIYLRLNTQKQAVVQRWEKPSLSSTLGRTIETVSFPNELAIKPLPTSLPLYKVSPQETSIDTINKTLNLSLQPTSVRTWQNERKTISITYDSISSVLRYTNMETEGGFDSSSALIINTDKAITVAESFVSSQLQLSSFKAHTTSVEYFTKTSTHFEESTSDKANVIKVPFVISLLEYDTFIGDQLSFPLEVYVDSTYKIISFTLSKSFYTIGSAVEVETIKTTDIPSIITSGERTILSAYAQSPLTLDQEKLSSFTIQDWEIEYRYIARDQLLYPFIRVVGIANTLDNQMVKLTVLLPAIQTK